MFHSAGEDQVILKELEQRIYNAQHTESHLHEQHDDEAEVFSILSTKVEEMIAVRNDKEGGRSSEKHALVKMMDAFAQHLYEHMDHEEKNIFPLVQQHFSIEDQDRLVRRAMAKVRLNPGPGGGLGHKDGATNGQRRVARRTPPQAL